MNRKMNKEGEQCASRVELDNGVTAITDGIVQMDTDLKQQITDLNKGQTDLMTEHDRCSENNHRENCDQHGATRRVLWGIVGSLIAVICVGVAYHFYTIELSGKRVYSLRLEWKKTNDKLEVVTREREVLLVEKVAAESKIESLSQNILSLYKAAEWEAEKHAEYYRYKDERADGLYDHIMLLNDQLSAVEKKTDVAWAIAERYRKQRDTKNQFMAISKAITEDNPVRLMQILDGENFSEMIFYPLGVQVAVGLNSHNILEHIQTLDGWGKSIPQELASRVISPQMVPLADYQKLKSAHDQQAGRLADLNKKNSRKEKKRLVIKNEKFEADHDTSVVGGQEEAENLGTPLLLR